jgi:methylmalonyl-CoA/ethylmalonyl-CoA epimerase
MLKRIDHVGVVVEDLDQASRFVGEVLGLEQTASRSDPIRGNRVAFFRCGETEIELIEWTDPEERSHRLGEARARIEHIAIEVDDLAATLRELGDRGVRTAGSELRTPAGVSLFSAPESTAGIGLQFIQRLPSH